MADQIIVKGRPDFQDHKFGVTRALKHPTYVFGNGAGLLVHKILYVELQWYDVGPPGDHLVRRNDPKISIHTCCGQVFFYGERRGKQPSTMCEMPRPEAILCGRCHGEGPIFGKGKEWRVSKKDAKNALGCNDIISVSS